MNKTNETIIQFFEWYLSPDGLFWNRIINEANYISNLGLTHIWLPPAYKGASGINDVGYGVYDLYDLGEFNQRESIKTKYGSKEEYINAINELHKNNLKVLADIVFNQKMGADETEIVIALEDNPQNRTQQISEPKEISAWTKFTFPRKK